MSKLVPFALLATVATLAVIPAASFAAESIQQVRDANSPSAASAVSVSAGKMLYAADGKRLGQVYRVTANGDIQLILSTRLVTVPASTLSDVDGKVTTSLSKSDLNRR